MSDRYVTIERSDSLGCLMVMEYEAGQPPYPRNPGAYKRPAWAGAIDVRAVARAIADRRGVEYVEPTDTAVLAELDVLAATQDEKS